MDPSSIAAVLFDMDGTLVDSDAAVERAWRAWAAEFDADPDAVLAVAHGAPAERTVRLTLPGLPEGEVASVAARQLELQYDDLSDVVATPGALGLLASLRLPWAVVTSADLRLARARLGAAGIEAPVLVTVEDVRAGKPDPEGYLRAAELLGVAARHCLVVEDAEVGVAAGRAAGARVAALKGVDGDLRIEDLGGLHRLLGP
ncbi:HAD-IA family hydrolase [Amorphoplanes digitatis]|uniref:Sugar-phosphatase n=1 Tax=Actinoplanes digitatis TaxID=1868 RepID=A0A7W7HUQ3_9ACTN|nr:HAD-IA family hydrolase [Actinoplanes digitatis]MBB4761146.1 sugar-phosphatase [Actinoplanes digitatis]